jgi:hypothetical protein
MAAAAADHLPADGLPARCPDYRGTSKRSGDLLRHTNLSGLKDQLRCASRYLKSYQ